MKPSKKSKRSGCQFYFIALILFSQTYPDMPSIRSSNVLVGHPLTIEKWVKICLKLHWSRLFQTCLNLSEIAANFILSPWFFFLKLTQTCWTLKCWFKRLVTPYSLQCSEVKICLKSHSKLVQVCLNLSKLVLTRVKNMRRQILKGM